MTFHVGQKVVCVDDDFSGCPIWIERVPRRPKKGSIYTIRQVEHFINPDEIGLMLHELINPVWPWIDYPPMEGCFGGHRFRPIVERDTDISIFKKMETGASKELEAAE